MATRSLLVLVILFSLITSIAAVNANANAKGDTTQEVMTTGLNHIGLTVKNLSASSDFFIQTLGWTQVGGYPDYPSIFVTDGKIFITLWQTRNTKKVVEFDRKNNIGLHHLALTVASEEILNVLHQRFMSMPNITIEFPPELNGKGPTLHMMIREPSGNRIEFAYTPSK
jgi:lactoylglutathione lyase